MDGQTDRKMDGWVVEAYYSLSPGSITALSFRKQNKTAIRVLPCALGFKFK